MLIGFTHKTSKILPRIFCRKFRHCAIILELKNNNYLIFQSNVKFIKLKKRDITILRQHGWVFIKTTTSYSTIIYKPSITCVSFVKRALGINAPFVWTPYQLYKKIKKAGNARLINS